MTYRSICLASLLALAVSLASCSSEEELSLEERSPEEIFQQAEELFATDPALAAESFEELERIHPYAPVAKTAMIRAGEAHFRTGRLDEAAAAAHRFIEFYPGDALAPRAQFLIALSEYDRISDVERDQSYARAAQQELTTLMQRYPDSPYARDARLMLEATDVHLAGKELVVGRYYLRRDHHAAAIRRFQNIVENYPQTPQVAEALHRLVEANLALGLVGEARRAAAILGHNFQGSEWYRDSFALLQRVGVVAADGGAGS